MKSESKWKNVKQDNPADYVTSNREYDDKYDRDNTLTMDTHDSPLKKALITSAIIAGGIAAYKSGLLKNGVSSMLEYASDYKAYIPDASKTLRNWLTKNEDVELNSIFRANLLSSNFISKFIKDSHFQAQVVEDTRKDYETLAETFKKNIAKAREVSKDIAKRDYADSDLMYQIGQMEDTIKRVKNNGELQKQFVRDKISEDIVRNNTLNTKTMENNFKTSGYTPITLGQILEKDTINSTLVNKNALIHIDKVSLERINTFVNENEISGQSIFENDMFKDLILDKNILVNQQGRVLDLRKANNSFKEFVSSLANDFQIPGLHINALRLIGLDHFSERKDLFAVLHSSTLQPFLTGKAGLEAKLELTHGTHDIVAIRGNIFKFDVNNPTKPLEQIASNMYIREITKVKKNIFGLSRDVTSMRKIAGINFKDYAHYTEADGKAKNFIGKFFSLLDIGFQDTDIRHQSFNAVEVNSYVASLRDMIFNTKKFSPHNGLIGNAKNMGNVFGSVPPGQKVFIAFNESKTLRQVFDKNSKVSIEDYFHQFIAGRHNDGLDLKNVTRATTYPYFIMERINDSLATVGLGLSSKSMKSTPDLLVSLVVKRFLPVWGSYQAYNYLVYSTEHKDKQGNKHNIEKTVSQSLVNLDLGWHHVKDKIGLTKAGKKLKSITPGSEQITDLPGLGFFDMSKTEAEKEDFWKNGEVAIRKGRYWDMGNTPFSGSKISYFVPNINRRIQSDYKFTDSQYGSRSEYFKNSPIPTLQHPLAPLNFFLLDRHHYEKKHYLDRPYLQSSPLFENVPIVGPLLASTIGSILKPPIKMHPEYWNNPKVVTNNQNQKVVLNNQPNSNNTNYMLPTLKTGMLPNDIKAKKKQNLQVYETSSGNTQVVKVDETKPLRFVNHELKKYSIKKVFGVQQRINSVIESDSEGNVSGLIAKDVVNVENPYSATVSTAKQFDNFVKISGIYGMGISTFITGDPMAGRTVIDTSGYMNSMSRTFFDQNTGGNGGRLAGIFKRFLNKRKSDITYYNPIKNTMPNWMPADGYFKNFHEGDPYTKIERGEARLPGEGYEKLHGIPDPMTLSIGPSSIGKSKSDIVKHLLNQDTITDEFSLKIVDKGKALHEEIEREWMKSGKAIDTEGKIEDKKNNILGFYDAIIHDHSAKNGRAVVDIKTVNAKKFNSTTAIHDEHLKQVNYYLYATGNKIGYIYYVNRDNPTETKTFRFKYDKKLLKSTLANLADARKFIKDGISDGSIGRGELYDVIDRYRVLADTAPYSQEFAEISATVSRMEPTEEQKAQISEIRKRMQKVKEPLRVYPYKFKTAKVQSINVHVTKVLDADTFMTKEFGENPIRLAGIHVSNDKHDKQAKISQEYMKKHVHEGAKIRLEVDADPNALIAKDTLKTIHAVVYSHGKNINKHMLDNNMATEKEGDDTPTGIRARFTKGQIAFGSVWETISHTDTALNTKYLQVRSALEGYKRREIYGKNMQSWSHPYKDFLLPSFQSAVNRPIGLIIGAGIGIAFGRGKYGVTISALMGVSAVGVGKAFMHMYEVKNGVKWIPKRRREEHKINEYVDMLKYVKSMKLYEEYAHSALVNDKIDVKDIINHEKRNGAWRKKRIKQLKELKRLIQIHGDKTKEIKEMVTSLNLKYATNSMSLEELEHMVNVELTELLTYRKVFNSSPDATKAIFYHNEAKQTMYGYDQGDPISNILKALPKKDRDYMKYFMEAPVKERGKILELAPKYLRRPLEGLWGLPVENKTNLIEYFKHRQLPGPKWKGWDEDVDMNNVKVKIVRHEAQDTSEFNIWDDQIKESNDAGPIPIPKINFRDSAINVRNKLIDLMHDHGLKDVSVDISYTETDANVSLQLKIDRRKDIEDKLREKSLI